jgi:hypothetical protein
LSFGLLLVYFVLCVLWEIFFFFSVFHDFFLKGRKRALSSGEGGAGEGGSGRNWESGKEWSDQIHLSIKFFFLFFVFVCLFCFLRQGFSV